MSSANWHEKLFESKWKVNAIGAPDAKIIFTKADFLQYEQFLLDKSFRQYLETIMVSKNILRMSVLKTPIRKTYDISTRSDSVNIDFLDSNKQFDWLEISLVYDKSYKHIKKHKARKFYRNIQPDKWKKIFSW